jgi:predicted transglutaminase-like cysteine proteinase
MLRGALWNVEDYSGLEKFSQRGDQLTWNDPGDTVGPHVFKVTLKVYTYAGVERSITKDVVREGYKEYTVSWTYNHNNYSIMVSIHTSDFIQYKDTKINRAPGGSVNSALVSEFVSGTSTSNDAFEYIVQQFNDQFAGKGLSQEDRINCVMLFVENIGYATDLDTTGQDEYWKFPIETLFAQGDCEDLAMLTMALFIAIEDLPTALFIFWNINGTGEGHAMAGIDLELIPHPHTDPQDVSTGYYTTNGRTYCSCETTSTGWTVGEIAPLLYDVKPDRLIEILPPS